MILLTCKETRGPKRIITPAQIREMKKILENEGLEGRSLTWSQLGIEAQVNVSEATIRRAIGSLNYHKCLACQGGWQSHLSPIENCWQLPEQHLKKYPPWDDRTTQELIVEGWGLVSQHLIS